MHKLRGFSIIELMVVLAVSSMLMVGLLQMYLHVMRSGKNMEEYMNYGTQIMAAQQRISQDFLGISKLWNTPYDYEHADNRDGNFVKEPEKIERQKTLYAKGQGNDLDICTFVTTNGLMNMQTGARQFVRVVYKTEQDQQTKLYKLLRKEIEHPTADIDQKVLEKGTWYTLLSGLTTCKFEYGFIQPIDLQQQKKSEKEDSPGLKFVQKWNLLLKDEAEEDEKKENQQGTPGQDQADLKNKGALPLLVRITLLFEGQRKDDEIIYYCPLYIDGSSSLPSVFAENKKTTPAQPGQTEKTENEQPATAAQEAKHEA